MRKYGIWQAVLPAAPVVVASVSVIALGVAGLVAMTSGAMAGDAARIHQSARHAEHAVLHRPHLAHRDLLRGAHGAGAYGAGYIYAPGRGIVDEACNLPTSACPNDQRDVQ
jgi:hypothetical protein